MTSITYAGQEYRCPFADLVPPLAADQRADLADHIARNGVQVAVVITDTREVIDGHNRLTIAAALNLPGVRFDVRTGLSDAEKRELAVAMNVHRRHMDTTDRRRLIETALALSPGRSNRDIAAEVGATHGTVQAARKRLEATGRIDQLTATTGRDGKTRRAKPARTSPAAAMPATPAVKTASPAMKPGGAGNRWTDVKHLALLVQNDARNLTTLSNRSKSRRDPAELPRLTDTLQRRVDDLRRLAAALLPASPEGET